MNKKHIILLLSITFCNLLFCQDSLKTLLEFNHPYNTWYSQNTNAGGDLNGDGYDDIVLCKDVALGTDGYLGEIKIYMGSAYPDTIADFTIPEVDINGYHWGYCISYGGDLNGDGYDDLVISRADMFQYGYGFVHIFFGGDPFDADVDIILEDYSFGKFGIQTQTDIDFNNDGYDDLLINSIGIGPYFTGKLYLYYGSSNFDTVEDWSFYDEKFGGFGVKNGVGDFNGDGYKDIALWHWVNNDLIPGFSLFRGGTTISQTPEFTISDSLAGVEQNYFGNHLSMSGDIDNDGCDDLIWGDNDSKIYLMKGNSNFDHDYIEWLSTDKRILDIEYCNMNNDEYTDLAVSFTIVNDGYFPGVFNVFYSNGCTLDTISSVCKYGNQNNDFLGKTIRRLGDINGDGRNDILVGSGSYDDAIKTYCRIYTQDFEVANLENELLKITNLNLHNYPNPFNPSTTIEYSLPENGEVEVSIYNIKGQKVKQLVKECQEPGTHTILWNGTDNNNSSVGSGVYFYKIKTEKSSLINKMIMLK